MNNQQRFKVIQAIITTKRIIITNKSANNHSARMKDITHSPYIIILKITAPTNHRIAIKKRADTRITRLTQDGKNQVAKIQNNQNKSGI